MATCVLSKRLAQLSINRVSSLPSNLSISRDYISSKPLSSLCNSSHIRPLLPTSCLISNRSFASGRKKGNKDNSLHDEWTKFQESLQVKAVGDTGSSQKLAEAIANLGKRSNAMKKKMVKTLSRGSSITASEVGGGHYPAARLSDEETERLLKEAYANIPARTGKRGTRNLKRQKRRWRLVRQIHKKYKQGKIRAHFKRMAKRGATTKECQSIRAGAQTIRDTEKEYQMIVLRGWAKKTLMEQDFDSSARLTYASVKDSKN